MEWVEETLMAAPCALSATFPHPCFLCLVGNVISYQTKRMSSVTIKRPRSVEEWMERLESRSLKFLQDQTDPCVRGYNGKEYDTAINILIKERMDAGETVKRHRPTYIVSEAAEEEGEVEVVPYGGKGGSLRIVHPK